MHKCPLDTASYKVRVSLYQHAHNFLQSDIIGGEVLVLVLYLFTFHKQYVTGIVDFGAQLGNQLSRIGC
jgi:hypothetical protein